MASSPGAGGIGGIGGSGGSDKNIFVVEGGGGGAGGFVAIWLMAIMHMITNKDDKIAFFIAVVFYGMQKQFFSTGITNHPHGICKKNPPELRGN